MSKLLNTKKNLKDLISNTDIKINDQYFEVKLKIHVYHQLITSLLFLLTGAFGFYTFFLTNI